MASFKDRNGRDWTIKLDGPKIRQIRTDCDGLDIVSTEGSAYDKMYDDPLLLCDALWILVKQEADAAGITGEKFFEAVSGDVFDAALKAILEAITDFFPSHKRSMLGTVAAKNAQIREIGLSRAIAKINSPELEQRAIEAMEKQMDEALERALTPPSNATSSPGS